MPLQPQTVDISLATGLDTKSDKKLANGMLELENALIVDSGAIKKRPGYRKLPSTIRVQGLSSDLAARFEVGGGLYNFNGQPILFAKSGVYDDTNGFPARSAASGWRYHAFDKAAGVWVPVGEASNFSLKTITMVPGALEGGPIQWSAVAASKDYLVCAYYERASNKVYAVARDYAGGFVGRIEVGTMTTDPILLEVFAMADGRFVVVYVDDVGATYTTTLFRWDVRNASTASSTITGLDQKQVFATYARHSGAGLGDAILILGVANDIAKLWWRDSDLAAVRAEINVAGSGANPAFTNGLFAFPRRDPPTNNATPYILTAHYRGLATSDVVLTWYSVDGTSLGTSTTTLQGTANFLTATEWIDTHAGADTLGVLAAISNSIAAGQQANYLRVDDVFGAAPASIGTAAEDEFNGNGSAGSTHIQDGFTLDDEPIFPLVWIGSTDEHIQDTLFLRTIRRELSSALTVRAYVAARLIPAQAVTPATLLGGGILSVRRPSYVYDQAWQAYSARAANPLLPRHVVFGAYRRDAIPPAGTGNTAYPVDATIAVVVSPRAPAAPAVTVNGGLILPGPVVGWFDGLYQELGHLLYPMKPTYTGAGAGGLSAGLYSWRTLFEWFDRLGNRHRSACSQARTGTPGAGQSATIAHSSHAMAHPNSKRSNIRIASFRTAGGGSVHNREAVVSANEPPLQVATDENQTSWTSTDADTTVDDNELLPLDIGEVEPIPPPASKIIFARRDRAFAVPYENPTHLWYTKPFVQGVGPEFSDEQVLILAKGGDIEAGTIQDDNIVLFKKGAIQAFSGEGPNALGQGAFTPPRDISTDIGASSQYLVTTRLGTIFRTERGFCLLDRSLSIKPEVGYPVTRYNSRELRAAVILDSRDAARFVLDGGLVLDLDLTHLAWSTFKLPREAVHAEVVGGVFHWVDSGGQVWREDPTASTDDGILYRMVLGTMWAKPSPNSEQRVWRLGLLGDVGDRDFDLKVSIYHDYDEERVVESRIINMKEADLAPDGTLFVEITPKYTRCKAIKLRIEDVDGKASNLALSTWTFDVGVVKRQGRQKAKRRF